MSGYPCCCRKKPACGECQGSAPAQYQLTVPSGVFGTNPEAYPQGCGEACEQYNGVFLLDYDPELTPITSSDVSCIWQSPDFELCYECHGIFVEPDPEPVEIVCTEITWHWRVELTDEFESDGDIRAYVFLISTPYSYIYMWSGEFHADCSAPLELDWEPTFLQFPAPGCVPNVMETLLLEVPA